MGFIQKVLALFFGEKRPQEAERYFRYKYLRYPFDVAQYFSVKADNQESADELAKTRFIEMFEKRQTIMTIFSPAQT